MEFFVVFDAFLIHHRTIFVTSIASINANHQYCNVWWFIHTFLFIRRFDESFWCNWVGVLNFPFSLFVLVIFRGGLFGVWVCFYFDSICLTWTDFIEFQYNRLSIIESLVSFLDSTDPTVSWQFVSVNWTVVVLGVRTNRVCYIRSR